MALPREPVPAVSIGVVGFIVAAIFAVVAALPYSRAFDLIVVLVVAFGSLVWLLIVLQRKGVLADRVGLFKEERERKRHRIGLKLVPDEMRIGDVDAGSYGFEVMFALDGLKDGRARLKPRESDGIGEQYRLEVHKLVSRDNLIDDETADGRPSTWYGDLRIVGYVSPDEDPSERQGEFRCRLFMRRDKSRSQWVSVPVDRVLRAESFPLHLDLEIQAQWEEG